MEDVLQGLCLLLAILAVVYLFEPRKTKVREITSADLIKVFRGKK